MNDLFKQLRFSQVMPTSIIDQEVKKLNKLDLTVINIEDLTLVVISYEIYETSLRRVS